VASAVVSVTGARPEARLRRSPWAWGLGAVVALGLVAWVYELQHGLAATGMRDVVSWGMYIFTFAYFVGLSAGGLIVASSAEVFGVAALRPLSRLGVLTALVFSGAAALMIIPDLGQPARILNLFIYPNWTSPLIWDITIIAVYFVFSAVEMYVMVRHPERRHTLRVFAYVGLPLAVLLHSITAIIFGLQFARPWWNTALMPPIFVASAITSGTAGIVLIAWIVERLRGVSVRATTWRWLAGLTAVALAIDLFFVACDYVTIAWDGIPADRAALSLILPGGPFQFTFWLEWVVGGLVPFVILVSSRLRRNPLNLAVAAALVLVGVYAFRIELVVPGFVNPLIQLPPGTAIGTTGFASSFQLIGRYFPTWVEYAITAGMFALIALAIAFGYRRLGIERAIAQAEVAPDVAP
jgi:molybdopterin-containing oxidoreductase family membrane subunit